MVALASDADVSARLGRALTADDADRIAGLLDEASAAVIAHLGAIPGAPVPDAVVIVVSRMVARVLSAPAPAGVANDAQTMGPFGFTRGYTPDATSGGVWLTRQDKAMLRPHTTRGRVQNVPTA